MSGKTVDKTGRIMYYISCPLKSRATCASGSVGGARPCQGRGRGFESRLALLFFTRKGASKRMLFFSCKKSPKGSSQWHELKFIPGSRSQPTAIKPDRFYQLISSRRIDACASTASARLVAITWSGLRSAQNRGPADLVLRLALFYYTKKEHPSGCSFLYHKIFSDRQVVSGWNVKVTTEVGNYIDYFVCVSLE